MPTARRFDVFLSHASEDKESLVRPLAAYLVQMGLRVWYDELSLQLGDSLRRSIDRGLRESRCGVVVLSPEFFAKEWPQKELDALVALESSGDHRIIPVWHRLKRADVARFSPLLADRLAVDTASGVQSVAMAIHGKLMAVRPRRKPDPGKLRKSVSKALLELPSYGR